MSSEANHFKHTADQKAPAQMYQRNNLQKKPYQHHQRSNKQKEFKNNKEIKIFNTEGCETEDCRDQVLMFFSAAQTFESALKKLKIDEDGNVCRRLKKIENEVKQKICSLEKCSIRKNGGLTSASLSTSTQSLCSVKSSKESVCSNTSERKAINTEFLKLKTMGMATPGQNISRDGDFWNISCPFCLKSEEDAISLIEHFNDCKTLKSKAFVKSDNIPYSVFQILPNNTFKCNVCPNSIQSNLERYVAHLHSKDHISLYENAASRKKYTESLFCSCCKIQIPNTATQINFHIEHEMHQIRSQNLPNTHSLLRDGIDCVYTKEKKFKCLYCNPSNSIFKNIKEILNHFELAVHLENERRKGPVRQIKKGLVRCSFCLVDVCLFSMVAHFTSSEHFQKESGEGFESFELCFFCGLKFADLHELAVHMESKCEPINSFKEKRSLGNSEKTGKDWNRFFKQMSVSSGKDKNEENPKKEGLCIAVKGSVGVSDIFKHFKKFGEIVDIDVSDNEAGVIIKYENKMAVERVLLSGETNTINGAKVEIFEELGGSNAKLEESRKESSKNPEETNPKPSTSTDTVVDKAKSVSEGSNSIQSPQNYSPVRGNVSQIAVSNPTIGKLFDRVTAHLLRNTFKIYSKIGEQIIRDCQKVIKFAEFHWVGFSKCELSYPVEDVTLYCELKDDLMQEQSGSSNSVCLTESDVFNEFFFRKIERELRASDLFKEINTPKCLSLSYITFLHSETRKRCALTLRKSSKILTDLLSECLAYHEKIRSFVLIIRFWLSVQKFKIKDFEYVIISILIYFLISKKLVNKDFSSFKDRSKFGLLERTIDKRCDGELRKNTLKPNLHNDLKEVFMEFLKFLNAFDFKTNAICLPLPHPVPKTSLLKEPVRSLLSKSATEGNAALWIMDTLLYNNLAIDVKQEDLDSLLKIVRDTLQYYEVE